MAKDNGMDRHLEEFRRKGGGTRQRSVRMLGGKLEPDGEPFHKEHLEFEDEAEGPQTLDVVQTSTCSFGHTVDDKVRVAGICEIGSEVLCSMEGCLLQCSHCGAVVCRRHGRTHGQKTYCLRHVWVHYWRKFWGIE